VATLDLEQNHAPFQIRAYQPGHIQVNDRIFTHSLLITPNQLIDCWGPQTIAELTPAALQEAAMLNPHILLIGTGATQHLLAPELYGDLINQGIGIEIMSTSAACRTFNALIAEDRSVVAALIIL
jgi:uncharacterized protein